MGPEAYIGPVSHRTPHHPGPLLPSPSPRPGEEGDRQAPSFRRLHPAAQHFGDAPGLGDAAAWGVGGLGVEDLADAAEAGFAEMRDEALQEVPRPRRILRVDA